MNDKGMYQLLAPFVCAIAVFLLFMALLVLCNILGCLSDFIIGDEYFFEDLIWFFNYFDGRYNTGGITVSVILWLISTVCAEMIIANE